MAKLARIPRIWIAALAVGVLVWGLTLWCMIAYRRRKDDDGSLPVQLQYNVPLEILYTVVPMLMVGALFYYTQDATTKLQDVSQEPDQTINIVGKQWSWDFNYVDAKVYDTGTQAALDGKPGAEATIPTLYLPVNKRVEFVLTARDAMAPHAGPGVTRTVRLRSECCTIWASRTLRFSLKAHLGPTRRPST